MHALGALTEVAKLENRWDRVLFRDHKFGDEGDDGIVGQGWETEIASVLKGTQRKLSLLDDANQAVAAKMLNIVEKESELAEVEKRERRAQKSREYAARVAGKVDTVETT